MMFHMGAPEDYDDWAKIQGDVKGGEGWSYKALKKYVPNIVHVARKELTILLFEQIYHSI